MVDGQELLRKVHHIDTNIIHLLKARAYAANELYDWQIKNKRFSPQGEHALLNEAEHVLKADAHMVHLIRHQYKNIIDAAHNYAKLVHEKRLQLANVDNKLAAQERALKKT